MSYQEITVDVYAANNTDYGSASNVGDSNDSTYWGPDSVAPTWCSCDFGEVHTVTKIEVWSKADAANGVRCKDFNLEYSDNDSDWNLQEAFQHTNSDGNEVFTVTSPSSHRYWRAYITSQWNTGGSFNRLHEFHLFETPEVTFSGSISAVSTTAGSLEIDTPLAGSCTASSGASGSLSVGTPAVSVITATSSVSGSLSVLTPLAGSVTATSSASGGLFIPADFTGSVTAASNVTGDMVVRWNLYGSTGSTSTTSASLNVETPLDGSINAVSTAAGSLEFTETRMQGAVNSVSGVTGSLNVLTLLAGSVTVISSVTGVIYDVGTITLAGSATGNSSVDADLDVITQLSGSITATSGTADFLILNAVKFKGVVSGVSSMTGYATCLWSLLGTITAASTLGTYTIDLYPDFGATTLFYRPQARIVETLEWMTSILKSHDGTEQRIKIRQSPRQHFRYEILLDTNKINNWIDGQVHGWLKLKWLVPVWTECVEHTADINHHDTTITLDTTEADFRDSGKAMVWKSPTEYEVVKITTVDDGQLNLNPNYGMIAPFTGIKCIMPVREAYITGTVNKSRYNSPVGIATMVFKIFDNINLVGWIPATNYDGMPVLNAPAFMERTHNEGSNPDNIVLDYKTGTFEPINHTDFNYTNQAHKFHNDTKTACWNFRKFLHSLNGKQKSVLIPTFRSDFVQSGTIVSGQTYVDIENIGLAGNVGANDMRKYIGFYFPSTGQIIIRKITSITSTAHSFIHTTTERINFNADLGYPDVLSPGDCQIGWVDKCRLASDKVELDWERINKNTCNTKFARIK